MALANTLAYYDTTAISALKSFLVHAPGYINNYYARQKECLPGTNTLAYLLDDSSLVKAN
jgi:hypothetical protein